MVVRPAGQASPAGFGFTLGSCTLDNRGSGLNPAVIAVGERLQVSVVKQREEQGLQCWPAMAFEERGNMYLVQLRYKRPALLRSCCALPCNSLPPALPFTSPAALTQFAYLGFS